MVGIQKKITQLLKIIQRFGPVLDTIVPGLGGLVGTLGSIGEDLTEGANNVYEDYQVAKKAGKKYSLGDGLRSFAGTFNPIPEAPTSMVKRPSAAMRSLTKSYGDLHPRLSLKSSEL
jgi:hypothetical protein